MDLHEDDAHNLQEAAGMQHSSLVCTIPEEHAALMCALRLTQTNAHVSTLICISASWREKKRKEKKNYVGRGNPPYIN
eukprot:1159148-Pelagomonas_calceolata.AAC.8